MEKMDAIEGSDPLLALPAPPQRNSNGGIEMELVDGKLVPKAQSLVIQAQAAPAYREVTEYSNVINNASYMKKSNNDRWQPEETEMFFQVDPSVSSSGSGLVKDRTLRVYAHALLLRLSA